MIAQSFEDLTQSLRIFLEAWFKFGDLILIDRAEAVGNVETGFNSVSNSFHNIYDAMNKYHEERPVDWYATPELCLILAIRNARHHNIANRIRNIFNYHVSVSDNPTDTAKYLTIDFEPQEEGGVTFEFFLSWADIDELLNLPSNESKLRNGTKETLYNYLQAEKIEGYLSEHGVSKEEIFINVVPLITNAGIALHPHIRDDIKDLSTESKAFGDLFGSIKPCLANSHKVNLIDFMLPA